MQLILTFRHTFKEEIWRIPPQNITPLWNFSSKLIPCSRIFKQKVYTGKWHIPRYPNIASTPLPGRYHQVFMLADLHLVSRDFSHEFSCLGISVIYRITVKTYNAVFLVFLGFVYWGTFLLERFATLKLDSKFCSIRVHLYVELLLHQNSLYQLSSAVGDACIKPIFQFSSATATRSTDFAWRLTLVRF